MDNEMLYHKIEMKENSLKKNVSTLMEIVISDRYIDEEVFFLSTFSLVPVLFKQCVVCAKA